MTTRTKYKSSAESIAWLDKDNQVVTLNTDIDGMSLDELRKFVKDLRRFTTLLFWGMKDLRVQLMEARSFINMKTEEEWKLIGSFYFNEREKLAELEAKESGNENTSNEDIETV